MLSGVMNAPKRSQMETAVGLIHDVQIAVCLYSLLYDTVTGVTS